jgi:hypothetical protein
VRCAQRRVAPRQADRWRRCCARELWLVDGLLSRLQEHARDALLARRAQLARTKFSRLSHRIEQTQTLSGRAHSRVPIYRGLELHLVAAVSAVRRKVLAVAPRLALGPFRCRGWHESSRSQVAGRAVATRASEPKEQTNKCSRAHIAPSTCGAALRCRSMSITAGGYRAAGDHTFGCLMGKVQGDWCAFFLCWVHARPMCPSRERSTLNAQSNSKTPNGKHVHTAAVMAAAAAVVGAGEAGATAGCAMTAVDWAVAMAAAAAEEAVAVRGRVPDRA